MFDIDNFPTREMARDMLSMVSPIYDKSYVGKWIFEVMGFAMEMASDMIKSFQEEEFPQTASKTLPFWEDMYGLPVNPALPDEVRRSNILLRRNYKRPMNPARIAAMVTDITGRPAYVRENTEPYTYEVCISPGTREVVLDRVREAIREVQQPKKVVIVFEQTPGIRIRAEPKTTVFPYRITSERLTTGTWPDEAVIGKFTRPVIGVDPEGNAVNFPYTPAGTIPEESMVGKITRPDLDVHPETSGDVFPYGATAEDLITGRHPEEAAQARIERPDLSVEAERMAQQYPYTPAGTVPDTDMPASLTRPWIYVEPEAEAGAFPYTASGTEPENSMVMTHGGDVVAAETESIVMHMHYKACGSDAL